MFVFFGLSFTAILVIFGRAWNRRKGEGRGGEGSTKCHRNTDRQTDRHTGIQKYIHTYIHTYYRTSDEAGPRGTFAPKKQLGKD